MEKESSEILLRLTRIQKELLKLWEAHAVFYRDLMERYEGILEEKRRLGGKNHGKVRLGKLKKSDLRDFPNIEFLRIELWEEALKTVDEMTDSEAHSLVSRIRYMIYENPYVYNSLREYTCGGNWVVNVNHGEPKQTRSSTGLPPSAVSTGKKVREVSTIRSSFNLESN